MLQITIIIFPDMRQNFSFVMHKSCVTHIWYHASFIIILNFSSINLNLQMSYFTTRVTFTLCFLSFDIISLFSCALFCNQLSRTHRVTINISYTCTKLVQNSWRTSDHECCVNNRERVIFLSQYGKWWNRKWLSKKIVFVVLFFPFFICSKFLWKFFNFSNSMGWFLHKFVKLYLWYIISKFLFNTQLIFYALK